MKNAILRTTLALALSFGLLVSCDDSEPNNISVGLISGVGGFDDMGFNMIALSGLTHAQQTLEITAFPTPCEDTTQMTAKLDYLTGINTDLIITLGFESVSYTQHFANENPNLHFAVVDHEMDAMPENMSCFSYEVSEAAFLCGYLAAFWSDYKDPQNPVAAWIAGYPYPSIEAFKTGYLNGINYYNSQYDRDVQSVGCYSYTFQDTALGAAKADSLINAGADVVFPFSGKTGNGALQKTKDRSKWAIGVDIDQSTAMPEFATILLTSCIKQLDVTVYQLITDYVESGELQTGNFYGNLENGGVNIAPFHVFSSQIPDSIQNNMNSIREQIISGTILTNQ